MLNDRLMQGLQQITNLATKHEMSLKRAAVGIEGHRGRLYHRNPWSI